MSYRINEGRLNTEVVYDRTVHILTLEAWGHGEPVNLTISRGMKQPQETLRDCAARQVRDMAGTLEAFTWKDTGQHATRHLTFETGYSTYTLGGTPIEQCVAMAQLTEQHLIFFFFSSTRPFDDPVLRQWRHLLDSFEPEHGSLPRSASSDTDDEDEGDT